MNVSVIGSGYVGVSHAACLAELGHDVVAIDIGEDIVVVISDGRAPTLEAASGLRVGEDFHIMMNPESLKRAAQSATSMTRTRSSSAGASTPTTVIKNCTRA